MQNFVFENPTKIIFGQGRIAQTGQEVRRFGSKVLLVYGQGSIKQNGVYDQVMRSLNEARLNITEFPGVRSNPVLSHVRQGIASGRREAVDVILAVGGGSVIDTAKTIAAGILADHDVWDFFTYKKGIKAALPILAVVTLSASASEMNDAAVITREEKAQKYSTRSSLIQPQVSILDPTALFSLSPAYSAYSAVDAISHMLEGYFNNTEPDDSILQDRLIEGLTRTVMESTETILKYPQNYNARANMMWSATLAFNGLTSAGLGRVSLPAHMIEHSLSALYDIAHGAGLSIVLPAWMKYAVAGNPLKFSRFARQIFHVEETDDLAAAQEGINRLKAWFNSIGSPVSLKAAGIAEKEIPKIAENAYALGMVWRLKEYTPEIIMEILENAI